MQFSAARWPVPCRTVRKQVRTCWVGRHASAFAIVRLVTSLPEDANAEWLTALLGRDVARATALLHEDYALLLVYPSAVRVPREEWIATLPGYVVTRWDVVASHWDRQSTVAGHFQLVEMEANVHGTERNGLFALTDTWLLTGEGWKV